MKSQANSINIVDIGDEGEGIGKQEGLTIFVSGALPGDQVSYKIHTQKKSYAKAQLLEVVKPSPDRITPPCEVYDTCGGCQIQALNYDAQLKLKEKIVREALTRIGGFENVEVNPILGMEWPFRYRNKGHYPVQGTSKSPVIGFFKQHSHHAIDVKDCLLQDERFAIINQTIRKYIVDFDVAPFQPKTGKGILKSVMIRKSEKTGEIMVVLVTHGRKLPMSKTLVANLIAKTPDIVSVIQGIDESREIRELGQDFKLLYGKETIVDQIGSLTFEISAQSFYQVNAKQTEALYELALDYANLTGQEQVYELYSGTGTISLFLAKRAKSVHGVEIVPEAVENAIKNAAFNQIDNVTFTVGKAEEIFPELVASGGSADVVVVDPPRAGCAPEVLEAIIKVKPKRIVYVSCKPSTLARDLKRLSEEGKYALKAVQPVDVFGHTAHVETVVSLERIE